MNDDLCSQAHQEIAQILDERADARRLDAEELSRYGDLEFVAGWELAGALVEPTIRLRVLLRPGFPFEVPRFGFNPVPEMLEYPNVEEHGLLCLQAGHHTPTDVTSVAELLFRDAVELANQVLVGGGKDRFREEFHSYWSRWKNCDGLLHSLCDPSGPSRDIVAATVSGGLYVADSEEELKHWLSNRFGLEASKVPECRPAAFLRLSGAPLPSEYPGNYGQLIDLIPDKHGRGIANQLVGNAEPGTRPLFLLGMSTPNGLAVAGVEVVPRRPGYGQSKNIEGFRPGNAPARLVASHQISSHVRGLRVVRLDASWVHGRDSNPATARLNTKRVLLIGAGSLGSGLARLLIQSGVGTLSILDKEILTSENPARHSLGLNQVGEAKSASLAMELSKQFPHAHVTTILPSKGAGDSWESLYYRQPTLFDNFDLVISALGDSASEAHLDTILAASSPRKSTLFTWLESRAAAAHAVLCVGDSGCFHCLLDSHYAMSLPVTRWADSVRMIPVPGCAGEFEPYGAVELAHAQALAAELALDHLSGGCQASIHRAWVADLSTITRLGGELDPEWSRINGSSREGNYIVTDSTYPNTNCRSCGRPL